MTKAQLITSLNAKYKAVAIEAEWSVVKTYLGRELLSISVMDGDTNADWENVIFVWKEGTTYTWRNSEPKSDSFATRLLTFIDTKIADNTVKFATIKNLNETNKKATIDAIMPDKSLKTVLLTETTPSAFNIEVI